MYKLSVGLGYSTYELMAKPFSTYSVLSSKIAQHRLILSPSLIDYYLDCAPEDIQDALSTYFDGLLGDDESSMSCEDDPTLDARQNLINFVNGMQTRVLIAQDDEFTQYKLGKMRKLISPQSIINDEFNSFTKYTFPIVNHHANVEAQCDYYSKWFGHLFENEEKITIIDPYLFADNGRASFEKYILPQISHGTRIDVYCELLPNGLTEDNILGLIRNDYSDWDVRVYICSPINNHNRYIFLKSIEITLTTGVCFLHPSGGIRTSCDISISYYKTEYLPTVIKVLCSK